MSLKRATNCLARPVDARPGRAVLLGALGAAASLIITSGAVGQGCFPNPPGGAPDVLPQTVLMASDARPHDGFGGSVVVCEDIVLVRAGRHRAQGSTGPGSAFVFRNDGGRWKEEQALFASDGGVGGGGDAFAAGLALRADLTVAGAPYADPAGLTDAGSAYVYRFVGGVWIEEWILAASDVTAYSRFGGDVATNGEVIMVSAPGRDSGDVRNTGGVYVFRSDGGAWVESQLLIDPNGDRYDHMGRNLAMRGDVMVATTGFDETLGIFVFRETGSEWVTEQILTPSEGDVFDGFGDSLAMSDDVVVVGAPWRDTPAGYAAGSVYVYRYVEDVWVEEQILTASNGDFRDQFGASVAIDGDLMAVGAIEQDAFGENSGMAYVFRYEDGVWLEQEILIAVDAADGSMFGTVGAHGDIVVVGAGRQDTASGDHAGSAYVFRCPTDCTNPADIDGDGAVGFRDLMLILLAWGPCEGDCPEDLDGSGRVDRPDVDAVLSAWGF